VFAGRAGLAALFGEEILEALPSPGAVARGLRIRKGYTWVGPSIPVPTQPAVATRTCQRATGAQLEPASRGSLVNPPQVALFLLLRVHLPLETHKEAREKVCVL